MSLAGSLMIIASSGWSDLSVTCSSKLGTCSGWGATTFGMAVMHDLHFWWACLAALFQVVPVQVYSACHSANDLMTSLASLVVRPALSLSYCARSESLVPCSSGGHFLCALLLFTLQTHIQWCWRSRTGIGSFGDRSPQASAYMRRNLSILNVVIFGLVVILS